jgi:hypothetical protein
LFKASDLEYDMGLARLSYVQRRAQLADYMPYLTLYDFVIASRKPREVTSLFALFVPFDRWIWMFIALSVVCEFLTFITEDKAWSIMRNSCENTQYIYEGRSVHELLKLVL